MATRDWLTLALTDGIGPILARRIIDVAGSAEAACAASVALLRTVEGLGTSKASKVAQSLGEARAKVDDELAAAEKNGAHIVTPADSDYPQLLQTTPDPPLVLYVKGTFEPRDLNAIAIVGSRKCSYYGREQAERFAALLAGAGFTINSGGARGVDSAAHRGAISHHSGRTIAVLGSGIDVAYPPENAGLFEQIAQRGAVVSEYPIGTPPLADNFPRRNRIVSGMSRGVLVIEADERSGALITARQAIDDQNRPVMAIPGRVDNPQSAGPHKPIRDGAILVTRIEHILEALGPLDASLPEVSLFEQPAMPAPSTTSTSAHAPASIASEDGQQPANAKPVLSQDQERLLGVLAVDPSDVDTLAERSGLEVAIVLRELTLLTLRGRARRVDGQRFVRIN
jgi:DNA processing protein